MFRRNRKRLKKHDLSNKRVGRTAKLRRRDIDLLEPRVMLSVALDSDGWTVVTPSANTRIIYVSSSSGNNSNSGLSSTSPVATISKAMSLVRNGDPDWILLKRGDVFNDSFLNWQTSGPDAQDPQLISYYGDPNAARPLLDTGQASWGFTTLTTATVNYVDIIGIQFYDQLRDPNNPAFNPNVNGGGSAIRVYSAGGNMLFEDDTFSFYRDNLDLESQPGPLGNITVRRCVDMDSWSTNSRSQGMYVLGVTNITVYQNVFDHNGWNTQISGAGKSGFNHDMYFGPTNSGVDVEENIIANASYAGIMARSGGTIMNNLILDCAVGISFGDANGADSDPGGVSGQVTGNIIDGDTGIGSTLYGQGLEVGNTKPGAGDLISDNIFTGDVEHAKPAIQLTMAPDTTTPLVAVGENDLTVEGNITNGWWEGLMTDGRFQYGGTGLYAFNNVTIVNNTFVNSTNEEVRQDAAVNTAQEHWGANNYYTSNLPITKWFELQKNQLSASQWVTAVDPAGVILNASPFPDPNRSAASYDSTLGGPGTVSDFLANAEMISDNDLPTQFMATAALDYIRAGFALVVTTPPPSPVVSVPNVYQPQAAATVYTFSVAYTDEFALNPATLDSNNLLVSGPNGFTVDATFVSAGSATILDSGMLQTIVTYKITPPGGSWTVPDDGLYSIVLLPNQIKDLAGSYAPEELMGNFTVDVAPPIAQAEASNVDSSSLGNSTFFFLVTYNDPAAGLDMTTLNNNEVLVTGPGGYSQFGSMVETLPGSTSSAETVLYSAPAPGGAWSAGAAGTYSISVNTGLVKDLVGNSLPTQVLTTFTANFSGTGTTPTGSISGTVFNDANGDGVLDARETPMFGVAVFVDLNLDNTFDPGDPVGVTDVNGNYTISSGLTAGQYQVVEQVPIGYQVTTPYTGSSLVTVAAGQAVTNVNFGDQVPQFVLSGSPPAPPTPTPPTSASPTPTPVVDAIEPIGPYIPAGWVSTAPLPTTPPPKQPPIVIKPTPKPVPKPAPAPAPKKNSH